MRRRGFLLPVAIAVAAPAAAEPPLGSRLGDRLRAEKIDEEKAAQHGHAIATCLANKRKPAVERFLAASDEKTMDKAQTSFSSGDLVCFDAEDVGLVEGRRVSWSTDLLRGMLAEALLKKQMSQVAAMPALPLRQGRYQRAWFALTGRNEAVDEMGACLADTAPLGIAAVLGTEAYSAAEKQAFGAIVPMMGKCLSAGAKLSGNRQALRAAMADALYQRLLNPAASIPPPAEGAKK